MSFDFFTLNGLNEINTLNWLQFRLVQVFY